MKADKKNYDVEPNSDENGEKMYEAFKGELAIPTEESGGRIPDFSFFYENKGEQTDQKQQDSHHQEEPQQQNIQSQANPQQIWHTYQYQGRVYYYPQDIRSVPEGIHVVSCDGSLKLCNERKNDRMLEPMEYDEYDESDEENEDVTEADIVSLTSTVLLQNDVVASPEVVTTIKPVTKGEKRKSVTEQLIDVLRKMVGSDFTKTLFIEDIYESFLTEYNYTKDEFSKQKIANRMIGIAEMYGIQHIRQEDTENKRRLSTYTGFERLLDDIDS